MSKEALTDEDLETLTEAGLALITAILNRQPSASVLALIKDGAPLWYQDDDGVSALHAAAYIEDSELVQHLIQKGAVWNAVDNLHNTAGDVALSLNNETCYRIIRDAGIRSGVCFAQPFIIIELTSGIELLLTLLSSRSQIPSSIFLKAEDDTAMGSTEAFLSSRLKYTRDEQGQEICLLDAGHGQEVGVMMGWERDLSDHTIHPYARTPSQLCQVKSARNRTFVMR